MSATQKKVPVVTYVLPEKIETRKAEQENRRKLEASYRFAAKNQEAILQNQIAEREKLEAVKKALHEEIERTHVIPSFILEEKKGKKEEKKKLREFELLECHRQKRLEQEKLQEQKEWTFKMKQFKKEVRLAKVVPLVVNFIPTAFQESEIGKAELLECESFLTPLVVKLAKLVGFDVEVDEEESKTIILLWKPYPYWREAFSDEKKAPRNEDAKKYNRHG